MTQNGPSNKVIPILLENGSKDFPDFGPVTCVTRSHRIAPVSSWLVGWLVDYLKIGSNDFVHFLHGRFLTIMVRNDPKRFSENILFLEIWTSRLKMARNDQKWAQKQGYSHSTRKWP